MIPGLGAVNKSAKSPPLESFGQRGTMLPKAGTKYVNALILGETMRNFYLASINC